MRFRPLHLAILIFQAIWLNVIVPGHQRGIVQLPGPASSVSADAGCPMCASSTTSTSHNQSPQKNPPGNCAICFFAAHMGLPPVIVWPLAPLGLLHQLEAERIARQMPAIVLPPFDCRGPPAVA